MVLAEVDVGDASASARDVEDSAGDAVDLPDVVEGFVKGNAFPMAEGGSEQCQPEIVAAGHTMIVGGLVSSCSKVDRENLGIFPEGKWRGKQAGATDRPFLCENLRRKP
jgi:hypothetical protein